MHLTASKQAHVETIDALSARIDASVAKLTALGHEWAGADRAYREQRTTLMKEGGKALERIDLEQKNLSGENAAEVHAQLQARRKYWLDRVATAGTRKRRALRDEYERDAQTIEASGPSPVAAGPARVSIESQRTLERRRHMVSNEIEEIRDQAHKAEARLHQDCRRAVITLPPCKDAHQPQPNWELTRRLMLLRQQIETGNVQLEELAKSPAYATCRIGGMVRNHLVVGLPHLLFAALVLWLPPLAEYLWHVAISAVVTQALVFAWTTLRRMGLKKRYAKVSGSLERVFRHLDEFKGITDHDLMPELVLETRVASVDDRADRTRAIEEKTKVAIKRARAREQKLVERIEARYAKTVESIQAEADKERDRELVRLRANAAGEATALRARLNTADVQWAEQRANFEVRWREGLDDLRRIAQIASEESFARHAGWTDSKWSVWKPATDYPSSFPIGRATASIAELLNAGGLTAVPAPSDGEIAIPVSLTLPSLASLLIRAGARCRQEALQLANACVLRALTAFPSGRLQLTLIDPIGLGDSFAPLLAIADEEESMLCSGILTEQTRIERGLEDLIAHLEKVIQKHLRGKYATIDEYNREAGEMQEALRLVVIADFPHAFSDRALEQLGVLLRSGARCGVHFVIVHDDRKPIPDAIDLAWFRRSGILLREVQGKLAIDREKLHAWQFAPEIMPPPELSARLLDTIAAQATSAKRIEVPFASIRPADDAVWSLSAAKELSIPIGKRGADRLQHLELGRGTCQHVLIGGRTGSGKSTLFHVIVTSAALWYSPREVQFMLIDFKKGVEFRAFAAHHLPHAQIIAIESDREFGLSVLRHLDQELSRRGELFRKAGAQDLAAHRRLGEEFLPRIMLLIDEFQEFFTEDDVIARDAALLLDRFVRQGRAFGVHVVLGSQTLGGSYALAKSSIGQMGVRIVLPCNEADAHLLLHEENDISRLLTRPGDAVYNDRAGLVDGNSPFQVCWLPEEEEGNYLDEAAAKAKSEAWKPQRPTVVFAGNAPSRLEDEAELAALNQDGKLNAWIGQSSSLKGATEVSFSDNAGSNLAIIGQNREAAAATCGAIALAFALRAAPDRLRLVALDGEDREGPFARLWAQLGLTRHESRGAGDLIAEISATLAKRQSGEDSDRSPIVLTVFGVQRLRQLTPDEDFGLSGGGASPGERFAEILAKGPENGIHVVAWCDSLASAQRGLGRRALRDFDQRILFQMSAADSSEMIDDDAASRLGLHTAILSVQSEGRREKFRPYSMPGAEFLEQARGRL